MALAMWAGCSSNQMVGSPGTGGAAGAAAGATGGAAGATPSGGATGGAAGATTGAAGATGGAAGTGASGGAAGGSASGGAAGQETGGTAGAAGAQASGGVGGTNCRPDVLIVQDKSGSMNNDDNDQACNNGCGANSKWSEVVLAITNVVTATDAKVNWGIKYFSDNNACGASGAPSVPVAAMAAAEVADSLARNAPGGNTPTRDAVTTGAAYLQSLTDGNPKFLLLVTDGLPNCPAGCATMSRPSNACTQTDNPTEDAAAEMAVTTAASQGFNTFVVGVGNVATAQNTLNQLALAGGEAQAAGATSYYAATDEAALEAALTSIVGKIAGCPGT